MITGGKSRQIHKEQPDCEYGWEGDEKHYPRAEEVWAGGVGEGHVKRG